MEHSITQAIAEIAADHRAGAAEIAERAATLFLAYAEEYTGETTEGFRHDLLKIGWSLIRAQPTMAPMVNLVNMVLWEIEGVMALIPLRQAVAEVADTFRHRLLVNEAAIAESVLPLIREGATILSISRSTTVKAALRHAHHAGRRFHVICAEARPGCEGRIMAAELSEYGIPVTLVVDALAIAQAREAKLVLVGADHLRGHDLVNKVGTYGLALAAKSHGVPFYALCGSDKFLPPGYKPPPQASWPTKQVWEDPPSHVHIHNIYFDHTSLAQVSGIVTEKGVLPTAGIEAWLAAIKLHPALKQA